MVDGVVSRYCWRNRVTFFSSFDQSLWNWRIVTRRIRISIFHGRSFHSSFFMFFSKCNKTRYIVRSTYIGFIFFGHFFPKKEIFRCFYGHLLAGRDLRDNLKGRRRRFTLAPGIGMDRLHSVWSSGQQPDRNIAEPTALFITHAKCDKLGLPLLQGAIDLPNDVRRF